MKSLAGIQPMFSARYVALMTFNALGVKMKDSDKTLAEFLGIEMPAPDVLEVVDVKADNLKEIVVVLSNAKLVKDEVALEDAANYRTNAGKVVEAKVVDNEVRLLLEGEMKQDKKYNLSIQDIQKEINVKKDFVAYDNTAPKVEEVVVLGTQGIRVTMSEPVKTPHEKDFKIDGKNFVMRVRNYGRDITLIPYRENGKFEEGKHELTIGQLTDFANFRSLEEKHEIEIKEDTTKPVVKRIVAKNNSVIVEFEQEVHPDSINKKNVSWTQIRGRKATEAGGYKILSGNRVEYTFDKDNELPKPAAEITVKGVKNYSGHAMDEYTEVVSLTLDYSRPEIVDWKLTDDDQMEIVFSKELNKDSAESLKNYTLYKYNAGKGVYEEEKYGIKSVKLHKDDKDVVVVTFHGMTEGAKYRLDIAGVRDNTTLGNTMVSDEISFQYGIAGSLKIKAVQRNKKDQIILVFNKDLVRREAEELRNYEFEIEDGKLFRAEDLSRDPSIYLYNDGKTVEINLPGNGKTIKKVHLGIALTALDGNRVAAGNRVVDLDESKVELNYALITKRDEMKLYFNQDIKDVKSGFITLEPAGKIVSDYTINRDGTITLKVTDAKDVTRVNIAANSLKTEYEEFRNKALSKATINDREGEIENVKVERDTTDPTKIIVTVEFNNELNNTTLEGLGVKVGGTVYEFTSHTNYKTFVFGGIPLDPSATKVEVEVLTKGVEDLDENEIKGKTAEYTILGTADADLNDVMATLNTLTADAIKGTNADLNNVKNDLVLPTTGVNGAGIAWTVPASSPVATDGTVTRPAYSAGNSTIVLTATVSQGAVSVDKAFTVTVLTNDPTSATINPTAANYTVATSADVTTTVTLNDATAVVKVNDGTKDLGLGEVSFNGTTNTLTITKEYLATKLTTVGETLTLTITFDVGDEATLVITAN